MRRIWLVLSVTVGLWGCSRSALVREFDASAGSISRAETCNGRDDNQDNLVDEPFRDKLGRYFTDQHCGQCGTACSSMGNVLEASCQLVDEVPTCVATRCAAGFGPGRAGGCVPIEARLCLDCADDRECGALEGAACAEIAGERRCTIACSLGCPAGYACDVTRDVCVPTGGSCRCDPGQTFELACPIDTNKTRLPGEPVCVGRARCVNGVQGECAASAEVCDEVDNNCDGEIDEGFRDAAGSYSLSAANCGRCGTSCLENTGTELELFCGGDPFAPVCALACPDAKNGISTGDKLDGDFDINNGCECTVRAVLDLPGPVGASANLLDENCDGADGVVKESVFVAADGNDTWAGSPTRPMRTITAAIAKASASLTTRAPRPTVYVASGSYTESLVLADGVRVLGGYRRDFRALDPEAFLVEVLAPLGSTAPGGAALVARGVGTKTTEAAWLSVRGLDTTGAQALALGALIENPGSKLTLRGVEIRAGRPGEGISGADGAAGSEPSSQAAVGQAPHAATENANHICISTSPSNRSVGGAGGVNKCGGTTVSGGAGGAAACPVSAMAQGAGAAGVGTGPGAGGAGGQDAEGPIPMGNACTQEVCCGLADFSVPTDFRGPSPGGNGNDGAVGSAGAGCTSPVGQIRNGNWTGASGTAGSDGQPGAGGGGGGAGGGVAMAFRANLCPFADGIGGGGGGGGAGGCGGRGGSAGTSGAPSVALLVVGASALTLEDVTLVPAQGADGGPGGAGGDGALGGAGAPGGALQASARTTPTLAGTFAGARGGKGGQGGAGGGGGGGCGGSSVGIWLLGGSLDAAKVRPRNTFKLATGGRGGVGGGGARPGSAGARGEAFDVVVQR